MTLYIGSTAPNFVAHTTQGDIEFHQWIGRSWALFFSHPGDFTPVCTTEVGRVSKLEQEIKKRNVKALGLSTDTLACHYKWIDDINETQNTDMFIPLVSDPTFLITSLYEMIHTAQSGTDAVRCVYIIDPDKKIRMTMTYPMEVGRCFDEILRIIDALQLADKRHVVTPADWHPGDQVIIPKNTSDKEAREHFPQGWDEKRPYLRLVDVA